MKRERNRRKAMHLTTCTKMELLKELFVFNLQVHSWHLILENEIQTYFCLYKSTTCMGVCVCVCSHILVQCARCIRIRALRKKKPCIDCVVRTFKSHGQFSSSSSSLRGVPACWCCCLSLLLLRLLFLVLGVGMPLFARPYQKNSRRGGGDIGNPLCSSSSFSL